MIYLDSSVALAQLFAEARAPRLDLWREPLTSRRLLQYEVWNRVHARRLVGSHGDEVRIVVKVAAAGPALGAD